MNQKLLFLFLSVGIIASAQPCIVPPPPGMNPIYAFDDDNDGVAIFDIGYYIDNHLRPNLESIHSVSTSGYHFIFNGPDGAIAPAPMYANIELDEIRQIDFIYTGSGPTLDPLPPCYWFVLPYDTVNLKVIAPDGDFDNDGILNSGEDTNNDGNLMNDDDDGDGILNIIDLTNGLGLGDATPIRLHVFPNPVNDGRLTIASDTAIFSVSVYDLFGREVCVKKPEGNRLDLKILASGTYLVKFHLETEYVFRKVIVQ